MTVIAALKKDGDMWLMGDRLVSWSDIIRSDQRNGGKMIATDHAFIACSGYGLYGNALKYFLHEKPDMAKSGFVSELEVELFFRAYHAYFKEHFGLGTASNNEVQRLSNGSFLLVTSSDIYEVCSNRDVTRFDNYHAIGSGRELALAVIHALLKQDAPPEAILRQAHETASHFNSGCGGDIDLVNVTAHFAGKPVTKPVLVSAMENLLAGVGAPSPNKDSLSA